MLDAAVSGGPHNIAAGDLTLFVGGPAEAVDAVSPLLGVYADPIIHAGAPGAGQCVKLVNNALFTAQIGAVRAAVELGAALGVQEQALLSALPTPVRQPRTRRCGPTGIRRRVRRQRRRVRRQGRRHSPSRGQGELGADLDSA